MCKFDKTVTSNRLICQVQSLFNDIVEESEALVKSEDILKRKREFYESLFRIPRLTKMFSNLQSTMILTKAAAQNYPKISPVSIRRPPKIRQTTIRIFW